LLQEVNLLQKKVEESVKETQIMRILLSPADEGIENLFGIRLVRRPADIVEMLQRDHDQAVEHFELCIHNNLLIQSYTRSRKK